MNLPIIIPKKTYLSDPYFFRNENVSNNKTYIAQPVDSIDRALRCIDIWNSEKYNIGNEEVAGTGENNAYTLYLYNSNKDIKKHFIEGKDKKKVSKRKILQYKKNNVIHTIALLEYGD